MSTQHNSNEPCGLDESSAEESLLFGITGNS